MRQYTRKGLNIKKLLELGDLDIRGMAELDANLTADDYFSSVERIIESADWIKKVLQSELSTEQSAKDIKLIKDILTDAGYSFVNHDLDAICELIKNGNAKLLGRIAIQVKIRLDMLFDRISVAYTPKKFANIKAAEEQPEEPVTLQEALEYLDYEEANRKLRILAVDDVSVVLNTLTSVLSPHYEVFALKNSSQVEKFLTTTTPELFLLDIEMSEMNGFDLIPVIRRFEEHKDTPIIFLTGNASYNNFKGAIALGACDFITKPVNKEILLEKIEKNIVRKKAY